MKSTEWAKCLALAAMFAAPVNAVAEPRFADKAPMALTLPLSPAQEAALQQRAKMDAAGHVSHNTQRQSVRPQQRGYASQNFKPSVQPSYAYAGRPAPVPPAPLGLQGYSVVGQANIGAARPR